MLLSKVHGTPGSIELLLFFSTIPRFGTPVARLMIVAMVATGRIKVMNIILIVRQHEDGAWHGRALIRRWRVAPSGADGEKRRLAAARREGAEIQPQR